MLTGDDRRRIDELATRVANEHAAVGLVYGVVHDGELAHAGGVGFADVADRRSMDADTVLPIASITKTFTTLAVLQLVEDGHLHLDDPVERHLRTVRIVPPDGAPPPTVRHVLTHTAGVGEVRGPADALLDPRLLRLAVDEPDDAPPLEEYYAGGLSAERPAGERWAYANHAFACLGQLVEDVTGEPFAEHVRERVLVPLGMTSTSLERTAEVEARLTTGYARRRGRLVTVAFGHVIGTAAGGGFSSVRDLGRYAVALMGGGANEVGRVVSEATLEDAYAVQWTPDPRVFAMGLGFFRRDVAGHRVVGHGGTWQAAISDLVVAPDDRLAVVAIGNGGDRAPRELVPRLLRELLGVPAVEESLPVPGVAERPETWEDLVGVYGPPRGWATSLRVYDSLGPELIVEIVEGHLHARTWRGALRGGVRLHPLDADDPALRGAVVTARGVPTLLRLRFSTGADGTAVAVDGALELPFHLERRHPALQVRALAGSAALLASAAGARWWRRRDR